MFSNEQFESFDVVYKPLNIHVPLSKPKANETLPESTFDLDDDDSLSESSPIHDETTHVPRRSGRSTRPQCGIKTTRLEVLILRIQL